MPARTPSPSPRSTAIRPLLLGAVLAFVALGAPFAGDEPLDLKKLFDDGIPRSPFAAVVYGYADAMIAPRDPRPLVCESPLSDQNVLSLLVFLRGLSGDEKYSTAADTALRELLASPPPRLERRPWMLQERCFELDAPAALAFAQALCAGRSGDAVGDADARRDGFFLRAMAGAYARAGADGFRVAVESVLERWEDPARRAESDTAGLLSLSIDADGAARRVGAPLRQRLRTLATRIDDAVTAELRGSRASLWDPAGGRTRAALGAMCVSRYENTARVEYRELVVEIADAYREALPADGMDATPLTFGQLITVELAAYRATTRREYFDRAFALGELALARFFDGSPLPRESLRSERRGNATGGDTLVLALVDLHLLTMQITAVRAPPNTLDR